jgi:hypothetical protein
MVQFPDAQINLNDPEPVKYVMNNDVWFNVNPAVDQKYGEHLILKEIEIDDKSVHVFP